MDDLDQKIIEILKKDSRTSFVDIGKTIGLSEAAVRRRVQNLIEKKTITKFTVEVSEQQGASAITLITTNPQIPTQKMTEQLKSMKGVDTVYEITGQYDIAVILSAPSIAEINACIDDVRRIEGVANTNTLIILRTLR
ncbi:MAG: Lrp/AsnC family transcriptional regulator [Thaumarchaeota archaeon]|nr:Lrp/AsnC family transcriptional regulator [Nitrososphaerota archaeon]